MHCWAVLCGVEVLRHRTKQRCSRPQPGLEPCEPGRRPAFDLQYGSSGQLLASVRQQNNDAFILVRLAQRQCEFQDRPEGESTTGPAFRSHCRIPSKKPKAVRRWMACIQRPSRVQSPLAPPQETRHERVQIRRTVHKTLPIQPAVSFLPQWLPPTRWVGAHDPPSCHPTC